MSAHATSVPGFSDLKQLADKVCDMRYDAFVDFIELVADRLEADHAKDADDDRVKLAARLYRASVFLDAVATEMHAAWKICKPYEMNEK